VGDAGIKDEFLAKVIAIVASADDGRVGRLVSARDRLSCGGAEPDKTMALF